MTLAAALIWMVLSLFKGGFGDDVSRSLRMTRFTIDGGSGFDDVTLTDASGNTIDLDGVRVTGGFGFDSVHDHYE